MPSIQLLGSLWVCVFVLIILCDSVDVGAAQGLGPVPLQGPRPLSMLPRGCFVVSGPKCSLCHCEMCRMLVPCWCPAAVPLPHLFPERNLESQCGRAAKIFLVLHFAYVDRVSVDK